MAHEGYQPVDRYMEAWRLLARRWDWKPVVEDGELVVVMLAKPSAAGGRVSVNSHPRGALGAMCQQPT